jgi:Ca-activated chloride channel family protein
MTLLAPERLALLVVPVLLFALYLAMQRRRRRYAVRFAAVELLDAVTPERPGWRRHLPALAYLAALVVLVVGIARPAMALETPNRPTVILALDTSYSMEATDVSPSRLTAARAAGRRPGRARRVRPDRPCRRGADDRSADAGSGDRPS